MELLKRIRRKVDLIRGLEAWQIAISSRLTDEIVLVNRYLDDFKSSFDVPDGWCDEFHAWRQRETIPIQPLVSIIIATRNRARILESRSLPSVLNQTYRNLEILVIGDDCSDDTAEVVKGFNDDRTRFLSITHRKARPSLPELSWCVSGCQPANLGLQVASGDFICHLDDDDEYCPERIEKLIDHSLAEQCDVIWHPYKILHSGGREGYAECLHFRFGHVTTGGVFYRKWFAKVPWDADCYKLREVQDWNRFRKFLYLRPVMCRFPEPLLLKYSS